MELKNYIRRVAGKIVGINTLQEEIDSLYYYLNTYADISKFPKATGNLRKLQQGDVWLLRIFDKICRKYHLEYWLDSGTLLGAVRHRGFIPWDDDIDVCMDRTNYENAVNIFPKVFGRLGINAVEETNETGGRIGIGYNHKSTGIWMDVFPVDYSTLEIGKYEERKRLLTEWTNYRKAYLRIYRNKERGNLNEYRSKDIASNCEKKEAKSVFYTAEFLHYFLAWNKEDIFPLSNLEFENTLFPVPHNTDSYLIQLYGSNYMGFPKSGITHHGKEGVKLSDWADHANVDMDIVLRELENIYNQIV